MRYNVYIYLQTHAHHTAHKLRETAAVFRPPSAKVVSQMRSGLRAKGVGLQEELATLVTRERLIGFICMLFLHPPRLFGKHERSRVRRLADNRIYRSVPLICVGN